MSSVADFLFIPKLICALGCCLVAGVFFAFSSFVMSALARLPPPQGIIAMQSINVAVINPFFMTVFLGTGFACLVLTAATLIFQRSPPAGMFYIIIGSALYLVGAVLVTIVFNVPLNDALAKLTPESADGANFWASYQIGWLLWNHVRGLAALAAAVSFIIALVKG